MYCKFCNHILVNKRNKFCNRTCANTYRNIHNHPRKGKGKGPPLCKKCKVNHVPSYGHKLCKDCRNNKFTIYKNNPTLKEIIKHCKKCKHSTAVASYIRMHARTVVCKAREKICSNCGYNKHAEICHIKAICSFPETAKLKEINAATNLVCLCPNCHWEYDRGLLQLSN